MSFEQLERREVMASQMMAGLSGSTLWISGTEGPDTIRVRQVNNQISIENVLISRSTGKVASVSASEITAIQAFGYGGNDLIDLGGQPGSGSQPIVLPTHLGGGPGNDCIIGGAGKDQIFGNDGDDTLLGMAGDDRLYGLAGFRRRREGLSLGRRG